MRFVGVMLGFAAMAGFAHSQSNHDSTPPAKTSANKVTQAFKVMPENDPKLTPFGELYPTASESASVVVPAEAFVAQPVSVALPGSLEAPFNDLTWLKGRVAGKKVFFFGESHWVEGIQNLSLRVVGFLAQNCSLRTVFLEMPYSLSGHYDYYVHLADDAEAERFFKAELDYLVSDPHQENLLRLVRDWNKRHSEGQISIGCNDLEWSVEESLSRIALPYFSKVDPKVDLKGLRRRSGPAARAAAWQKVDSLLKKARKEKILGNWTFLTPEYMTGVMTSIRDTFGFWESDDKTTAERQRRLCIVRDMTDPAYNGKAFESGLVFVHGGSWHAQKRPDDDGSVPDAAYLDEEFAPTKGRIYSLMVGCVAVRYDKVAALRFDTYFPSASMFNDAVRRFQTYSSAGGASTNALYLWLDRKSAFHSLLARTGYTLNASAIRVETVDWSALTKALGGGIAERRKQWSAYDDVVVVLTSSLEPTRLRPRDGSQ